MEVIADGSGDGITLPFPTSLASYASFIQRPRNGRCCHSIVFNLPGHVVNDVLFKPIRNEHSIAADIPSEDGLRELLVRCSELIHGLSGSLRDESSLHLSQCTHQREEKPSHGRRSIHCLSVEVNDVQVNPCVIQFVNRGENVCGESEHSVQFHRDNVCVLSCG